MKRVAVVYADSVDSPTGLPSRIYEEVGGESIIRRLLRAVGRHPQLDAVIALTRKEGEDRLRAEVGDLPVKIKAVKWRDVDYRPALRAARKWSGETWRGGLWSTTTFDEEGDPVLLKRILDEENADRVIKLSGHTPFFDAAMLSDMIDSESRLTTELNIFVPHLPPGFAYEFYWGLTLTQFADAEATLRNVFRYDPKSAKRDPLTYRAVYGVDVKHLEHPFRFLADSRRGLEMFRNIHAAYGDEIFDWGFEKFSELHLRDPLRFLGRLPKEVEVEITTRQNIESKARPRPKRCGEPADMPFEEFQAVVDSLVEYDDVLMTFGGWGDPLLHPEFSKFIDYAHEKGIYGIHVTTPGSDLSPEMADYIAHSPMDALTFQLDAGNEQQYEAQWGRPGLESIVSKIGQIHEHKMKQTKFSPFIVADFVKSRGSFNGMEDFFERWYFMHRVDAVIRGFNNQCGQVDDDSMAHLTLSVRRLCEPLKHRMHVLVDGRVPLCGQDFEGLHPLGNAFDTPLGELWMHPRAQQVRQDQVNRRFDTDPLCAACRDWDHL